MKYKKRSKYGNKKIEIDGIKFHSKKEAARYSQLKILERTGQISDLQLQVKIPLLGRDGGIKTPTGRQAYYIADFTYLDHDRGCMPTVEDCKGFKTDVYKLKKAILEEQGIYIRET